MKKRKFILFLGIGWAGTTSLYKTLQFRYSYMHGGFNKESEYLIKMYIDQLDSLTNNYGEVMRYRQKNELLKTTYGLLLHNITIKNAGLLNKMFEDDIKYFEYFDNIKKYYNVLNKFSERKINHYFATNYTLEKYVEYYEEISDYCENNFKFIGDFSNNTGYLNEDILSKILSSLSKKFDVHILLILRDPIRRSFSNACYLSKYAYNNTNNFLEYFEKNDVNYANLIKKAYKIFGKEKVLYLVMEDLFKKNEKSEISKLEHFLDVKIPSMHPCCYVPDMGINAPKIPGLTDQSKSDYMILSEEFYLQMKKNNHYTKVYNDFEELHGSLPADWGLPIDYQYAE